MDNRVSLGPPLPQMREGVASPSRPASPAAAPAEPLQTRVPDLGPFTLGPASFYDLQIYPGPMLKVVAADGNGASLDVSA